MGVGGGGALASGVPVVAPAAGGPLDLVHPGRTGCLVPPGDRVALAAVVEQFVADPVRRAQFGVAARTSVEGRTWAAIGDELIAHYRAVCGRSTVDAAPDWSARTLAEAAALEREGRPLALVAADPVAPVTRRRVRARASIG